MGGGAAGFFSAINTPEGSKVLILEKNKRPLQKVKVSGGGRCNVTHFCFDPQKLVENYPRGSDFLLEPFGRFGPQQTIDWFNQRGVSIKKESDGRMFPDTDSSQTIIDCFLNEARRKKVELRLLSKVLDFENSDDGWLVRLENEEIRTSKLLIATGSDKHIWERLKAMSLDIIEPVPSLFTFHIEDSALQGLTGTPFPEIVVRTKGLQSRGPGLITHWGMSGPGVLKLSAFGARVFFEKDYCFDINVDWLPRFSESDIINELKTEQASNPKKKVRNFTPLGLSKRFWEFICNKSQVSEHQNWSETGKKHFKRITESLKKMSFEVNGKSTFKDEFVTAGGISLEEVDPKTFQSIKYSGLYFAGEVLDIDAVTGGFNFQAAWTGGWHVASSI
ncbi:BaiN/RdsA family NAD(P)/FAD-dependent oxidoreductase [Jiulongibacter sediminis]|uniref:NAD(P)/FAD-dependent oxidoreductase n=1 Tax=Jiulongibacter sediminis TaxID=1605367 RepID=UPI0021CD8435|nr:NAD(P)/FAD-dependent oxidoreductase [Jiulongibacter sediminis]